MSHVLSMGVFMSRLTLNPKSEPYRTLIDPFKEPCSTLIVPRVWVTQKRFHIPGPKLWPQSGAKRGKRCSALTQLRAGSLGFRD